MTLQRNLVGEDKIKMLGNEDRLREVVKLVIETLPILNAILASALEGVTPAELRRLERQHRLEKRLLTLALHVLSNLPDDPEERAERLATAVRLCSDLGKQEPEGSL